MGSCPAVWLNCVFEGERWTGSGNSDAGVFCLLRRGSLKRFEVVDGAADEVRGIAGDTWPETCVEAWEGERLIEGGHKPPVLQSLSLCSVVLAPLNDFRLLNEPILTVEARSGSGIAVPAL